MGLRCLVLFCSKETVLGLEDVFWVSNTPVPRLFGVPVQIGGWGGRGGWRPTWQDFGRKYKRFQLLRCSIPGLEARGAGLGLVFGLVCLCHDIL